MRQNIQNRQQGVALIYVLLIFSVITLMASKMVTGLMVQTQKSSSYLDRVQARFYVMGAEQYIATVIEHNIKDDLQKNRRVDTLDEPWNLTTVAFEVDQGAIEISVRDEQGRFNINNLASQDNFGSQSLTIFQNLLMNRSLSPDLAYRVKDWVDSDRDVSARGAEDDTYLLQAQPLRTPNTRITSISELQLIDGLTKADYLLLSPDISTLPVNTRININTAPRSVLLAISNELSTQQVDDIIQHRSSGSIANMNELLQIPSLQAKANVFQAAPLTFSSRYFSATIYARYREADYAMRSWFRVDNQGKVWITRREIRLGAVRPLSQGAAIL